MDETDELLEAVLVALQRTRDERELLRIVAADHPGRPATDLTAMLRLAATQIDRSLRRDGGPTAESSRARAYADALDAASAKLAATEGVVPMLARLSAQA